MLMILIQTVALGLAALAGLYVTLFAIACLFCALSAVCHWIGTTFVAWCRSLSEEHAAWHIGLAALSLWRAASITTRKVARAGRLVVETAITFVLPVACVLAVLATFAVAGTALGLTLMFLWYCPVTAASLALVVAVCLTGRWVVNHREAIAGASRHAAASVRERCAAVLPHALSAAREVGGWLLAFAAAVAVSALAAGGALATWHVPGIGVGLAILATVVAIAANAKRISEVLPSLLYFDPLRKPVQSVSEPKAVELVALPAVLPIVKLVPTTPAVAELLDSLTDEDARVLSTLLRQRLAKVARPVRVVRMPSLSARRQRQALAA